MADRVTLGATLTHPCPECGAAMVLRDSKHGLFYGCRSYPRCQSTHGAHQATGQPLGIPADKATKLERTATHALFERLWEGADAPFTRQDAYRWMAAMLDLSKDEAHIGRFDVVMCQRLRALVVARYPALAAGEVGHG